VLRAAGISSERRVALQGSSRVDRGPNIRRARALQDLAAAPVPPADVQDLARVPALARPGPAALVHHAPVEVRLPRVRLRVRSVLRTIADAAVASSIRRPRKVR